MSDKDKMELWCISCTVILVYNITTQGVFFFPIEKKMIAIWWLAHIWDKFHQKKKKLSTLNLSTSLHTIQFLILNKPKFLLSLYRRFSTLLCLLSIATVFLATSPNCISVDSLFLSLSPPTLSPPFYITDDTLSDLVALYPRLLP